MMKSKTQVRSTRQFIRVIRKQAGMTLMEIIAALAIIAAVVVGALALFNSAQSSNQSVQMLKDIIGIRASVQQLYMGQGGYGTASLNTILRDSKKIPSDMVPDKPAVGDISTPLQGKLTVTGASSAFTIEITNVPTDVCVQLLTNASSGWAAGADMVKLNGTAISPATYPISPSTASTECVKSSSNTILWKTLQ